MPDNSGWDRITPAQADTLRAMRKELYAAKAEVANLASRLLTACPHIEEEHLDTCRICVLYRALQDAASEIHDLPDVLDAALLDGPSPAH